MKPQIHCVLQVLVDACRARGRDIIIIATEIGGNGGPVTRHYLNVPPCPDNSPASCMSPSDVVLTTGSPNSPEGESVFNFRAAGERCWLLVWLRSVQVRCQLRYLGLYVTDRSEYNVHFHFCTSPTVFAWFEFHWEPESHNWGKIKAGILLNLLNFTLY